MFKQCLRNEVVTSLILSWLLLFQFSVFAKSPETRLFLVASSINIAFEIAFLFLAMECTCFFFFSSLALLHFFHSLSRKFTHALIACDASNIPYEDNSFDISFTHYCIEQVPHLAKKIIDEMIRISSKYILIVEPSYQFSNKITASIEYNINMKEQK